MIDTSVSGVTLDTYNTDDGTVGALGVFGYMRKGCFFSSASLPPPPSYPLVLASIKGTLLGTFSEIR